MIRKISKKQEEKNKEKAVQTKEMFELFRQIWDEREDEMGCCYCFETGKQMHGSIYRSNSAVYDHVLEKSTYPQYKMVKKNIVIIHPEVHQQKGNDVSKTPKIEKYRNYLLELHLQGELKD